MNTIIGYSTAKLIKDTGLSEASQFLESMESIETPDDLTVVMKFSAPQAFNCTPVILILPEHIWGGMPASDIEAYSNENPVGTGAESRRGRCDEVLPTVWKIPCFSFFTVKLYLCPGL